MCTSPIDYFCLHLETNTNWVFEDTTRFSREQNHRKGTRVQHENEKTAPVRDFFFVDQSIVHKNFWSILFFFLYLPTEKGNWWNWWKHNKIEEKNKKRKIEILDNHFSFYDEWMKQQNLTKKQAIKLVLTFLLWLQALHFVLSFRTHAHTNWVFSFSVVAPSAISACNSCYISQRKWREASPFTLLSPTACYLLDSVLLFCIRQRVMATWLAIACKSL